MKKYVFILTLLLLVGCEKDVELQYEGDKKEAIVLDGYVSPQGGKLFISRSTLPGEILDWDDVFLNDALAILFQDTIPIDTFTNIDSTGHYLLVPNDNIVAGSRYRLEVSSSGLEKVVVRLAIPESLGDISANYESISPQVGQMSINFNPPSDNKVLVIEVTGFDSLGISVPIYPVNGGGVAGECAQLLSAPRYFYSTDCLHNDNPRIFFKFEKESRDFSKPFTFVQLRRIIFDVSYSDEQYKYLYDINEGDNLGYVEPHITKSNVEGGYGVVLPKNSSIAEIQL